MTHFRPFRVTDHERHHLLIEQSGQGMHSPVRQTSIAPPATPAAESAGLRWSTLLSGPPRHLDSVVRRPPDLPGEALAVHLEAYSFYPRRVPRRAGHLHSTGND